MSRSTSSRLIAALLLATALLVPGPAAAEPLNARGSWTPGDLLAQMESLFTRLWNKAGCKIDPHGACIESQSASVPSQKAGCKLDPHGACIESQSAAVPSQKIGCGLDPHGRCGT